MKTLVLSIVFALTFVVNAVSNNKLENFAYNTEKSEDRVKIQTIFKVKQGKFLQRHLQYTYAYDAEGRVSAKEILKWNQDKQCFEKQYCLQVQRTDQEITVKYVAWNKEISAYTEVKSKTIYQKNEMGMSYQSYAWNQKENNWDLVIDHDIATSKEILFAENR